MKEIFDRTAAFFGLVVLSPLLALVAVLVVALLGRPVLFRQQRPGLHGRLFTVCKFRTMRKSEASDEERLTGFGRLLRRSSLDELPQLYNILRGDMSLVGPRPLLAAYLPLYSPEQARRHEVRPGITGWAQVNGRNAISWEEKFALDVWYVDNRTFLLDLKILARTFTQTLAALVKGRGISQPGRATADPFTGNRS